MSKPTSGTALDSGGTYFGQLTHAWAFLENTGTSTADAKGSDTGTLDASTRWGTDSAGDPAIVTATGGANVVGLATPISFDGKSSYSIAFRAKQAAANANGCLAGDISASKYLYFNGGNQFRVSQPGAWLTGAAGDTTTEADWLVSYNCTDATNGLGDQNIYRNGVLWHATISNAAGAIAINRLACGYSAGTANELVGSLSYFYTFNTALGSTDAGYLHSTPYGIYAAGGGPALAGGTVAIVSHSVTGATVSGTACTGGTATFTYQFQRSDDDGSNAPVGDTGDDTGWTAVGSPQAGLAAGVAPSNAPDSGLSASTKYWYRYKVTDSAGSPATAYTSAVSVTTYATATTYTLTAPSPASGPVGAASGNFTLQLSGYKATSTSITLSVATIAGTFSPASPVTLPSGNNSSVTFTLTPSSAGTGTVSASSGGALTDPAGVSYTASSSTTVDLTAAGVADPGDGSVPAAYVQIEGGNATLGSYGGATCWMAVTAHNGTSLAYGGGIRFRGSLASISVHAYHQTTGSPVQLAVDGTDYAGASLPDGPGWPSAGVYDSLFTGLDNTAEHEYRLTWGDAGMAISGIQVGGTVGTSPLPPRPLIAFMGDSVTADVASTDGNTAKAFPYQLANMYGYQAANRGVGSTGYYYPGGTGNAWVARIADITGMVPTPSAVVFFGVLNDALNVTQAQFDTAVNTCLTSVRAAFPGVPILVEGGELTADSGQTATTVTWNGYLSADVAALDDPLTVFRLGAFLNYDPALGGGTHPNGVGGCQVAVAIGSDLRPLLPTPSASSSVIRIPNIRRGR